MVSFYSIFQAQWWTKGSEPSLSTWGNWVKVDSSCAGENLEVKSPFYASNSLSKIKKNSHSSGRIETGDHMVHQKEKINAYSPNNPRDPATTCMKQ